MISKDYLNPQNLFGVKILLDPLLLEESVEFQVLVGDAGSDSRLPRNLWKTPQKTPPPLGGERFALREVAKELH